MPHNQCKLKLFYYNKKTRRRWKWNQCQSSKAGASKCGDKCRLINELGKKSFLVDKKWNTLRLEWKQRSTNNRPIVS